MTPPPKLEQGKPDDEYPLNDQASEDFNVGGVKRTLPPVEQLEQLVSYMDVTYPRPDFTPPWRGGDGNQDPADRYVALLPDRITHAAMMMLGTAVDHTAPGVAYAGDVTAEDVSQIRASKYMPSDPTGRWAVSFHGGGWWRGSGDALEHQWRPEVAAAAELSGTIILDVDYPLAPTATIPEIFEQVREAIGYARSHNPESVTAWGYSSGAALAAMTAPLVDALVLTYPDLGGVAALPEELRDGAAVPAADEWPRTLLQLAQQDEVIDELPEGWTVPELDNRVEVLEYVSQHRISTPEVARQRIQDTAKFLREA